MFVSQILPCNRHSLTHFLQAVAVAVAVAGAGAVSTSLFELVAGPISFRLANSKLHLLLVVKPTLIRLWNLHLSSGSV